MENFYTTKYRAWGADRYTIATFDNKDNALDFYNKTDYCGKPIRHTVKKVDTINKFKDAVATTTKFLL